MPPNAAQSFTLTVNQAPAITNANNSTFAVGTAGTFSVTTTGFPVDVITKTGALPGGVTFTDNGNGTATLAGTPSTGSGGNYLITITASNGVMPNAAQNFTLTVDQAPAITSASSVAFVAVAAGTFTVATSGMPANVALTKTGTLPSGVTFTDNGNGTAKLAGIPAAGTGGAYPIVITANNGIAPNATQNFTLTVDEAAAITSAASSLFVMGNASTFSVTTSGFPAITAITRSGNLPAGVTFTDNGNGTGTLAGTPAAGTTGIYPLTFTATNGVGASAAQSFALTIGQAPALTSATSATLTVGTAGTFNLTTSGFPLPSVTKTGGTLPPGITFVDNGNGTATLSGTPAAGAGGVYPITFTIHNGVGPDIVVNFTLTVDQSAAITTANQAAFTVGTAGTFGVTTAGYPLASLSVTAGTLPPGITFVDNENGTGTLSGTPAINAGGVYTITLTAHNGIGADAKQTITITVGQVPAFTNANGTTFTAGTSGTFTVSASGFPTPALARSGGTLPGGVTFTDNGNGTATLKGNPSVGGVFNLTFTAANSAGTSSQSFALTVNQAPQFVSAPSLTLQAGVAGSLTVMTTGYPIPTLSESGTLPSGVAFTDNGDSTGTLGGTATQAGISHITLTATSSSGTVAQSVTVTVTQQLATGLTLVSSTNPSTVDRPVTFTATVSTNALMVPTGSVTFMDSAENIGSAPLDGNGVATISISSLAVGTHSIAALYGGDANFAPSISNVVIQVAVQGALFTVSAVPPAQTMPAGSPAQFTISAAAVSGFSDSVTLSCASGLPAGASCAFSPTSIVPGSTTSAMTVNTTSRTMASASPSHSPKKQSGGGLLAMWSLVPALLFGTLRLSRPHRRRVLQSCLGLVFVGLCLPFAGCGSGSETAVVGTPAGKYTVVVVGTDARNTTRTSTSVVLTVE